ncbi:phage tail protein [Kitasatospora viridis]|uniref:Phage tail-like protein n=1 Tax=Kitasatospora viridis TaxID=281105 RepID=A0A561TV57_9ACTN|nr:phage tail protein [Kitasatospora viridis]TWF90985.1 phage tail-like protein [Kitasatospora viridis]
MTDALDTAENAQGLAGGVGVAMSHRYAVLIDNVKYHFGDWAKVSGLTVRWEPIKYRVGGQGNQVRLFPGLTEYQPIKLSRAAGPYSRVVQHWLAQTAKKPQPQSGTIQLVDFAGTPLVQWRLNEFFPIAWTVEDFGAEGGRPAIETLELAHHGFLDDDLSMLSPI